MTIIRIKKIKSRNKWLLCSFIQEEFDLDNKSDYNMSKRGNKIKIKCVRCGQIRYVNKDVEYKKPFVVMAVCNRDSRKLLIKQQLRERVMQKKELQEKSDTSILGDLVSMGKRYLNSRAKWIEAGKPLRDDKTIIYIYDNICSKCEHFSGKSCKICGCRIARAGTNLNKLAWETENCPDYPAKWSEFETRQDIILRHNTKLIKNKSNN